MAKIGERLGRDKKQLNCAASISFRDTPSAEREKESTMSNIYVDDDESLFFLSGFRTPWAPRRKPKKSII